MSLEQNRIYLKNYKPPTFQVESIHMDFCLDEEFSTLKTKTHYKSVTPNVPLVLDGKNLELTEILLNDQVVPSSDYLINDETLTLFHVPNEFTLTISTRLQPQNNTSLDGLYKSNGTFCTQCEAEGFRKITYFMDRPDVMTQYSVTIEANKQKYPILLSNGNRIKIEDLGNGRHKAFWQDPFKKPSYLFALVAGDLGVIHDHFITRNQRKVNLEIYAPHGKQNRCFHAMESLKKSIKWDEDTFGLEYDLDNYMIVAIDDFNMGAMENKGLNIFNSKYVLADKNTATDTDYFGIESVVAHEYFHNWTGNRVTCRDWFQLSLKEGLTVYRDQEFSADSSDRGVCRIDDVNRLRSTQFAEDASPNAHPVRPESCMSVDNFYTSTIYEKGAEVIRMMQNIFGKNGFRKGMDLYFKRHDGQAVTTDDFVAAIFDANNADPYQFKRWYTQSGTPVVKVLESFNSTKKEYALTLEQQYNSSQQEFQIPLLCGFLDSSGQEILINNSIIQKNSDKKNVWILKEKQETLIIKNVETKPTPSLLREFSAPIILKWEASNEDLYLLMNKDEDAFNRYAAAYQLKMKEISNLIRQQKNGEQLQINSALIQSLGQQLKSSLAPAMIAKMIDLPDDSMIAQQQKEIHAAYFANARWAIESALSEQFEDLLLETYYRWHGKDVEKTDAQTMGHRSLKNYCLYLLAQIKNSTHFSKVTEQYFSSKNMTDRIAAMNIIANSNHSDRSQVLNDFYNNWKDDTLVLNKWFVSQSLAEKYPNVLNDVKKLLNDPCFHISNPNNVYSLIWKLSDNFLHFHDNQNNVYAFYADMIIKVDEKNPQVAAKLCDGFSMINKLPTELKHKMQEEIYRILEKQNLSKNSRELLQTLVK